MKANELTTKDLMIGDWVIINNIPRQVTFIDDCINYKIMATGKHPDGGKISFVGKLNKEIKPIPLTPEILEKNGFKSYIPEGHLETVYACQDISKAIADELYALWPYQDDSFYLLLRVDGKDMVRIDVHYIHQLQHALRLCGIDKTIEL